MPTRMDQVVVLVRDLPRAARDYAGLGFSVTPGGEHADGLTRNALVPFDDGSYLELVAFVDPEDGRDNVWGWRPFLSSGGGLIDYCAASDNLEAETRRLGAAGFGVDGPDDGGRRLPGGTSIRWRSARIRQEGRLLPFLIEDLTPRELRVPGDEATRHPNGATGISRLTVAASDPGAAAGAFAALIGAPSQPAPLRLGPCDISISSEEYGGAKRRLDAVGPGPLTVELNTGAPGPVGELDRRLAHGADIRLVAG